MVNFDQSSNRLKIFGKAIGNTYLPFIIFKAFLRLREAVRETRPNKKIDFRFNFFYVFFLEAHLKRSQTVNFEKLKISTSSWTSVEMPKNDNFEIFNFF